MAIRDSSTQADTMPDTLNSTIDQTSLDHISALLNTPVSKLDADQYMAEDLDGITEGLLGSGNLNYLVMQAEQTNGNGLVADQFTSPFSDANPVANTEYSNQGNAAPADANFDPDISTDRSVDQAGAQPDLTVNAEGTYANTTVGSLSASGLSGNTGLPLKAVAISNSGSGVDGLDGDPGYSQSLGVDGSNGSNGMNGTDGDGTTIIINEGDIDIDFGDITNIYDILDGLGPLTIDLDVLLSDLSEIILDTSIFGIVNQHLERIIDLNPILDLVSSNLDLADLITGTLGAHISLFGGDSYMDADDYDLLINADLGLLGLPALPLSLDVPLDPLEQIIGDIDIDVGSTIDGLAGDLLGGDLLGGDILNDGLIGNVLNGDLVNGDLLGGIGLGDAGDDTDVSLDLLDTGLTDNVTNVIVDPVEDLVGDIDLVGDAGIDLLGINGNETDNSAGDTDLVLDLDIDLLDQNLLDDGIALSLDPLEEIVGDIDLDLDISTDILGDSADGLIDGLDGGTEGGGLLADLGDALEDTVDSAIGDLVPDIDTDLQQAIDLLEAAPENLLGDGGILGDGGGALAWPENNLPEGGDLLGGIGDDMGSSLPDPLGSVTEGIGLLPFSNDGSDAQSGGLLGGGLFG